MLLISKETLFPAKFDSRLVDKRWLANNMTGPADVRLCKLGGGWLLVKWMYQALFFPSRAKEAKKQKNNNNNAKSQVSVSLDTESLLKAIQVKCIQGFAEVPMSAYGPHIKGHGRNEKLKFIAFST